MPEHREAVKDNKPLDVRLRPARLKKHALLSPLLYLFLEGCATPEAQRAEPPQFRCSGEEGYWQGRAGFAYTGWCTPGTAAAFLDAHQRGREIYELYRRRAALEQEISRSQPGDAQRLELARRQIEQVSELIRRLESAR